MPSRKNTAIAALLLIGSLLAAANVWYAAARSLIPLSLDAVVRAKQVRHEKHPPKDDVHLLDLGEQGLLHVDQAVFDAVNVGDRLRKERWSRVLECGGRKVGLEWSADTSGMIRVMPLVCVVMAAVAVAVSSQRK